MFPSISSRAPSGPHPGYLGSAYQLLRFARKIKHRPQLGKLGCAHKFPRYNDMGPVWAPSGLSGFCPPMPVNTDMGPIWAPSGLSGFCPSTPVKNESGPIWAIWATPANPPDVHFNHQMYINFSVIIPQKYHFQLQDFF